MIFEKYFQKKLIQENNDINKIISKVNLIGFNAINREPENKFIYFMRKRLEIKSFKRLFFSDYLGDFLTLNTRIFIFGLMI